MDDIQGMAIPTVLCTNPAHGVYSHRKGTKAAYECSGVPVPCPSGEHEPYGSKPGSVTKCRKCRRSMWVPRKVTSGVKAAACPDCGELRAQVEELRAKLAKCARAGKTAQVRAEAAEAALGGTSSQITYEPYYDS